MIAATGLNNWFGMVIAPCRGARNRSKATMKIRGNTASGLIQQNPKNVLFSNFFQKKQRKLHTIKKV